MTDDIFQKSNIWGVRRGVYCANDQFDDVRNCDHVVVGMPYTKMKFGNTFRDNFLAECPISHGRITRSVR